jgi:hypothetical protein
MYIFLSPPAAVSLATKEVEAGSSSGLPPKKRGSCISERFNYEGMRAINVACSECIQHQVHGFRENASMLYWRRSKE